MLTEQNFENLFKNKEIPILVLDQKWHRLFAIHGKTDAIKNCEAELDKYLAKQGQLNNSLKELKKLKTQLMQSIVENMDLNEKKEEDKKYIDEINQKIDAYEDELLELPKEIQKKNHLLMKETMEYCYEKLKINEREAKEIDDWITQIRIDLKRNIIRKQNREINNREMYAYMHDIFGASVLDLFDTENIDNIDNTENAEVTPNQ